MADTSLARSFPSSRRPVAWVTGASSGLGRATALGLARAGYELVLAGRSLQRHEDVLYACDWLGAPVRFVELDLADLGSVARAAAKARSEGGAIEALVLNAGVAGARGRTIDGFELAFGVNHLGHLLLATILMPLLRASRAARVVTVQPSSVMRARRTMRATQAFVGVVVALWLTRTTLNLQSAMGAIMTIGVAVANAQVYQRMHRAKAEGVTLTGPGGLLGDLTRRVLKAGLEGEMDGHVGYEKPPWRLGTAGQR